MPQFDFSFHLHIDLVLCQWRFVICFAGNPWVLESLYNTISVRNTFSQQPSYQRLRRLTDFIFFKTLRQKFIYRLFVNSINVAICRIRRKVKWMLTRQHLKNYNSEGPHINSFTISLSCCLLRRHEQNCSSDVNDFVLATENI